MEQNLIEGIIFTHTHTQSWILCGRLNVGNDGVC
jgi:hypothetical protein